jgi:hypothetical protein
MSNDNTPPVDDSKRNLPATPASLAAAQEMSEEEKKALMAGSRHPNLKLSDFMTPAVKRREMDPGIWYLDRSGTRQILGDVIRVIPLAFRNTAIDTKSNPMTVCHDPKHEVYMQTTLRSQQPNSGAMEGPEVLVWVETSEFVGFATWGLFNKSSKRSKGTIMAAMNSYLELSSSEAENANGNNWMAPVVQPVNAPTAKLLADNEQEMVEQITLFRSDKGKLPDPNAPQAPTAPAAPARAR